MQFTFNFTLEKKIFLKKHNNSIKVGLFYLYFEKKKMSFFSYNLGPRKYTSIKKQEESNHFDVINTFYQPPQIS